MFECLKYREKRGRELEIEAEKLGVSLNETVDQTGCLMEAWKQNYRAE